MILCEELRVIGVGPEVEVGLVEEHFVVSIAFVQLLGDYGVETIGVVVFAFVIFPVGEGEGGCGESF